MRRRSEACCAGYSKRALAWFCRIWSVTTLGSLNFEMHVADEWRDFWAEKSNHREVSHNQRCEQTSAPPFGAVPVRTPLPQASARATERVATEQREQLSSTRKLTVTNHILQREQLSSTRKLTVTNPTGLPPAYSYELCARRPEEVALAKFSSPD
eukprot:6195657-Pleurochrysis_carterae.AAC.1